MNNKFTEVNNFQHRWERKVSCCCFVFVAVGNPAAWCVVGGQMAPATVQPDGMARRRRFRKDGEPTRGSRATGKRERMVQAVDS
jgi:hypothetical protein